MTARKLASVSGTAVVAAIAAYASYEHMRALALAAGQTPGIAAVLPFSVDGMILVASVALVDGRQRKASAWVAFGLGVLASVLANVLAAGPTLTDRCVSAWPSVALLATVEVIARGGSRKVATVVAEVVQPSAPETVSTPEVVSTEVTPRVSLTEQMRRIYREAVAAGRTISPRDLADATGADPSHARRVHGRLVRAEGAAVANT